MATDEHGYDRMINPIDLVEQLATANDWAIERPGDDRRQLD
jgi:hypothetical protein